MHSTRGGTLLLPIAKARGIRSDNSMKRYCILDGDECALVEEKLDEAGIDYDWGPLDRLIVENDEDCDEVEDILDECDIAYFAV